MTTPTAANPGSVSWEKSAARPVRKSSVKVQSIIVSAVLLAGIAFMIISGTQNSGKFFITVDELMSRQELHGKSVKVSGAVIGDTIRFDQETRTITFTIAHVPDSIAEIQSEGGLAKVLHEAVADPEATRLQIVVKDQAVPDLLRDEAQAIMTGTLDENGVFHADELFLKCPSKYEGSLPEQSQGQPQGQVSG